MRIAGACIVVAFVSGCGFDAAGQSDLGGAGDDSSVSGGDGLFPTDDGAVHGDTRSDSTHDGSTVDTAPSPDTTPEPDTAPPPDTCLGDGGACLSPGHCASGVYLCSGSCSATDPSGFGTTCTSSKGCSSAVACDGSCPDPVGVGGACTKSSCTNGTLECDLTTCDLPAGALSVCPLSCAATVYANCYGLCPSKSPLSGTTCMTCICGSIPEAIKYDDCGACPGCDPGCTEGGADAGGDGRPSGGP